jgi:hypothetical protein
MVIFHVAIVKLPEGGENMAMTWAYRDMGRFHEISVLGCGMESAAPVGLVAKYSQVEGNEGYNEDSNGHRDSLCSVNFGSGANLWGPLESGE